MPLGVQSRLHPHQLDSIVLPEFVEGLELADRLQANLRLKETLIYGVSVLARDGMDRRAAKGQDGLLQRLLKGRRVGLALHLAHFSLPLSLWRKLKLLSSFQVHYKSTCDNESLGINYLKIERSGCIPL